MIRFVFKVFLLFGVDIGISYAKYKWKCDKCGKVNVMLGTEKDDWDGKINGDEASEEDIKKHNEKMLEELKEFDKERQEFEKKSPEEKKQIFEKNDEEAMGTRRVRGYALEFNDKSYICDDRIVGDKGEKHKAKFKKDCRSYVCFVYNGVPYISCHNKSRCEYCFDGKEEDAVRPMRFCIDLSKIKEKNKDGFCEFDIETLSTFKKNICCLGKACECLRCRAINGNEGRKGYTMLDNIWTSREYKMTDLLKKLEESDKWCRFEDCRGVVIGRDMETLPFF